jgi:3-methyladenine DNA glycosylase AlkD
LRAAAKAAADPAYREGARPIIRPVRTLLGTRVPDLKRIAATWGREHPDVDPGELRSLVYALCDGATREEQILGIMLLRGLAPALRWSDFDRLRRSLDTWEATDGLAHYLAEWVAADLTRRSDRLRSMARSRHLWTRRLAVVTASQLNRHGLGIELTVELVDQVRAERDPMITKAVSWALRELAVAAPHTAEEYLERRADELPAIAIRETRNKLRTGKKSGR